MAKITFVELECPKLGRQTFEVSHAERLLAMPKNGGWTLPQDSDYEYDNGVINRRNKKGVKGAEEA